MAKTIKKESIYLPIKDFPYLERYKSQFSINENEVAFPYKGKIYSNKPLDKDLEAHEFVHFKQQKEIGDDNWEEQYLTNPWFRIRMEVEAYTEQLKIAPKEYKDIIRSQMAKALSSPMYGNVITYKEAFGMIK